MTEPKLLLGKPRKVAQKPNARSPWCPLRHPIFRWLWIASVALNIGTWFQSATSSPSR